MNVCIERLFDASNTLSAMSTTGRSWLEQMRVIEEKAIALTRAGHITNAQFIELSRMMEQEYSKPMEEWSKSPLNIFREFLNACKIA